MREGMLHIRDVEGPKKTTSVEMRLEAMEQQVFKCQGMVERGLNANHMMITEFTNKHMIDANDIGKHLSGLYDRIDQLHGQIYDLQNQNCVLRYEGSLEPKRAHGAQGLAGREFHRGELGTVRCCLCIDRGPDLLLPGGLLGVGLGDLLRMGVLSLSNLALKRLQASALCDLLGCRPR
ncbi:40S ribosomal protein S5-1 [Hordeum vulgare]|nr:40S ribosomal protein S5-1 [Hordeum vulgare]